MESVCSVTCPVERLRDCVPNCVTYIYFCLIYQNIFVTSDKEGDYVIGLECLYVYYLTQTVLDGF